MALAVQAWLKEQNVGPLYIAPGSPWENAYVESFNSRLRDEHLNREEFASLLEAQVLAAGWRRVRAARFASDPSARALGLRAPSRMD